MDKEISSGTMIGIVLIALAAVIGIGFMTFSIAKGVSNEGVVELQENIGNMTEAIFNDYDQKIVTGTQVTAAYKKLQGEPIAILINTQAITKDVKTHIDHTDLRVFSLEGLNYINYNALLTATGAGEDPKKGNSGNIVVPKGFVDVLTLKDGIVSTQYGFAVAQDTGTILYDSSISGFTKAGNAEYISPNSKYNSNLIKDLSGDVVGIVFTQQEH